MTRKDFEMIARVFHDAIEAEKESGNNATRKAAWRVVERMADTLRESNPRYDRGRFIDAVVFGTR